MFKRGTIILVPFPFTDLSAQKVRPALIVSSNKKGEDVIVCFVSSIISGSARGLDTQILINEKDPVFANTGLKVSSIIGVDKIVTLDKKIILGELGSLDDKYMRQVDRALKKVLGL